MGLKPNSKHGEKRMSGKPCVLCRIKRPLRGAKVLLAANSHRISPGCGKGTDYVPESAQGELIGAESLCRRRFACLRNQFLRREQKKRQGKI
jgi:hypothetical protein